MLQNQENFRSTFTEVLGPIWSLACLPPGTPWDPSCWATAAPFVYSISSDGAWRDPLNSYLSNAMVLVVLRPPVFLLVGNPEYCRSTKLATIAALVMFRFSYLFCAMCCGSYIPSGHQGSLLLGMKPFPVIFPDVLGKVKWYSTTENSLAIKS